MQKIGSATDKAILLALGLVALVFLYSTKSSQVSGMSIGFAALVNKDAFFFHPHHLLYQPMLKVLDDLFGSSSCDAICTGQLHSIVWGVVAILSSYVIANRALGSKPYAIATALSILALHGFAVFATQLEPYVPALGMSSLLAAIAMTRESSGLGWRYELFFIAVMSLSLLFHQAMLFFFIPLAFWLISNKGRDGFVPVFRMFTFTGVIVLSTYVAVFWSMNPDKGFVDFYHWMMYYQVISDTTHGTFQDLFGRRLREMVFSITQLFIALRGTEMPDAVFVARLVVSVVVPLVIFWNVVQVLRKDDAQQSRTMMLVWAGVFGLFFFWWQASVYKFFIPILVPIAVLTCFTVKDLADGLRHRAAVRGIILGTTAVTLIFVAVFNLRASVLPLARSPGAIYNLAEKLTKAAPEYCNLYSMRYLNSYAKYYFDREALPFNLMFRKHYYSTRGPAVADTIDVSSTFDHEQCAVIPLYWISRDYFVDRTKQAIGSYLTPNDWSQFIEWFFDVREGSGTGEVTHSAFREMQDDDGDRYLVLDRTTRAQTASVQSLIDEITDIYGRQQSAGSFMLGNQPEIGARRHLAFGYN